VNDSKLFCIFVYVNLFFCFELPMFLLISIKSQSVYYFATLLPSCPPALLLSCPPALDMRYILISRDFVGAKGKPCAGAECVWS
jgi:hypothetical protein